MWWARGDGFDTVLHKFERVHESSVYLVKDIPSIELTVGPGILHF
jgi:hypothetical protein